MKLKEIFEPENAVQLFQLTPGGPRDDMERSDWIPLEGDILKNEVALDGLLDGTFLLRGAVVLTHPPFLPCWVEIEMPEGVPGGVFLRSDQGQIVWSRGSSIGDGQAIPLVPIEKYLGYYEIYYSKLNPEIGLDVLKKGLTGPSGNWFYAFEIGCILRDEKRYSESIDYFKIALDASTDALTRSDIEEEIGLIRKRYLSS